MEVDRCQTTTRSTDMQNPLEHLEANVRPTWHGNASARTGGRGLNDCGKKDAASSRCYLDPLISSYHSCCPCLPFLSLFRFFPHWFVYVKSLWLTQLVTYLYPLIVPVLGMIRPCGATRLQTDLAIHVITNRGTTPHCSVTLDGFWSSST